jgi:hypothetical protein
MKTFVRHAVTLLAITVACQAGLALAEDYYQLTGNDQTAMTVGNEKTVGPQQSACSGSPSLCGCQTCGNEPCCCSRLGCENDCSSLGIVGFMGMDAFNGIADSPLPSNFGVVTGFNAGAPIAGLSDYGLGWQIGISYGLYDFDGRAPVIAGESAAGAQQQTFVTTGFFRKAHGDQRVSFGVVYDWMFNTNWGVFGNDPTLGQWRGQIEYALSGRNGIGLWGAKRDLGSVQVVSANLEVADRAISQASVFWHHKFCSGADSWLWIGIPDHGRLDRTEGGSLGDWILGANVQAPLTKRLALYGNFAYMHPSAAAGAIAANETTWDVGMGVAMYFGGTSARTHAINGNCWTPYIPVANNSTFFVDEVPLAP